jgi:hypothetical protein
MESAARGAITDAVTAILQEYGTASAIAGGASGADILFHEVCAPARRAEPACFFPLRSSASSPNQSRPAGDEWVRRFHAIAARVPVVIASAAVLLGDGGDSSATWIRNNQWLLDRAREQGVEQVTVLALWNGERGDDSGGDRSPGQGRARQADSRSASSIPGRWRCD